MKHAIAVLALLVVAAAHVSGHHGWAGYAQEEFEISGVLQSPVSLAGAHGTTKIKVGDQVWDIVLAPPARTSRAGLREKTIPVGAAVTIHGHRHLNPKRFEVKAERVIYDGKIYDVYPDRD